MKSARLISATAAIAAGVALLSPGGSSYAGWYEAVEIPTTTIASGQLEVEHVRTSVELAGSRVVVTASSRLAISGDALRANLSLTLAGYRLANGTEPTGMTREVITEPAGRLSSSAQSWQVDRAYDGTIVTARIELPIDAIKSLAGQPRVSWQLSQASPGRGWYSEAVHEISFAGLWPTTPIFPELACAPTTLDSITLTWTSSETPPMGWEVLERNSAGNNLKVLKLRVDSSVGPDGRIIYSVTLPPQNDGWLYSVRMVGATTESQLVSGSCAVVKQGGN
jgi:alternate signal-mediated exported protein